MGLRVFSLTTAALVAVATFAWATEGDPVGGTGVSVEASPGGIVATTGTTNAEGNVVWRTPSPGTYVISISGPTAVAACSRVIASLPDQLEGRIGRGIAVGRAGGAFLMAGGPANGPGVVVSLSRNDGRMVAAQWAPCDTLLNGRPAPKASLTPITLDRTQAAGPLNIGVGYVAGPTTRGG